MGNPDEKQLPKAKSFDIANIPVARTDFPKLDLRIPAQKLHDQGVTYPLEYEDKQLKMNCPVQSEGPSQERVCIGPKGIKGRVRF